MKRVILLLLLPICQVAMAFTPAIDDNPAKNAGYYYSWCGGELGYSFNEQDFTRFPRLKFNLYQYTPSREDYNYLKSGGYDGQREYLHLSLTASKRYSSLLYGGATFESGYRFSRNRLMLGANLGVLYKETGNLDYGVQNNLLFGIGKNVYTRNRLSLSGGLNFDKRNRLSASLISTPDIEIGWESSFGNYFSKIMLQTDRIIDSKRRLELYLLFGVNFTNYKRLTRYNRAYTGFKVSDHFEQVLSFNHRYGNYTPPITYSPTIFPIAYQTKIRHGLALMKMMDNPPEADIVITVRRGDYLNRIAHRLPPEADETFRGNLTAIANYNSLTAPYTLHPGQQIRVPTRKMKVPPAPIEIDENVLRKVDEAISAVRTSDYIEMRLNGSLWGHLVYGEKEMRALLPVKADIENKFLLNTQSLVEIETNNSKSAVRKLFFALKIDEECPVLTTNLAIALFLDNRYQEAIEYFIKGRELAVEKGLDTTIHDTIIEEILVRLKR